MKSEVYRTNLDTQDKLLDHVTAVISCMKEQDALRRVPCHVLTWVANYIDAEDGIVKNLLY
jgi:hypothetical protein